MITQGKSINGNAHRYAYPWKAHTMTSRYRIFSPLNQTVLPDDFLLCFKPTFLIRHPALVFPSYYRAHVNTFGKPQTEEDQRELESTLEPFTTFSHLWKLFEFYAT
jgi:hypothetical protein